MRRIFRDTVAPSTSDLAVPADTISPQGCLNIAEGNGSYDVTATCDSEGSAALQVGVTITQTLSATAGAPVTFTGQGLSDGDHKIGRAHV